jgi:hypothetical protein
VVLFAVGRPRLSELGGFQARGSEPTAVATETSRVFVYRIPRGGRPAPVEGRIGKDDELAFAYENRSGRSRVAIFGVDEHGHVYWFHPAWSSERDDPVAVSIALDGARHELTEAVRHDLDGKRLEIHALFLDRAATVREIEAMVGSGQRLGVDGAVDSVITLEVTP